MDDGDLFYQTIRASAAIFYWADKNPSTAGLISIGSISTDLCAIAALQSLKMADEKIIRAADANYDRALSFVIRFVALMSAMAVFTVASTTFAALFLDRYTILAAVVASPIAVVGWFYLPKGGRKAEVRLLERVHGRFDEGRRRDALSRLIRLDPRKPGFMINLFYSKILFLDSIICPAVVFRLVRTSLTWLRVPS